MGGKIVGIIILLALFAVPFAILKEKSALSGSKNVGEKIKVLANLVLIIGIISSLALGAIAGTLSSTVTENGISAIIAIIVALLGIFAALILKWLIYGYGEIISTNIQIAENTKP